MAGADASDLVEVTRDIEAPVRAQTHLVNTRNSSDSEALHPCAERKPIRAIKPRDPRQTLSRQRGELAANVNVGTIGNDVPYTTVGIEPPAEAATVPDRKVGEDRATRV